MNVAELIARLEILPQDKEVVIMSWDTHGDTVEVITDVKYIPEYDHVTFATE